MVGLRRQRLIMRPAPRVKSAKPNKKANIDVGFYAEATAGFEPANGGFADLCLTTWLRRRERNGELLIVYFQLPFYSSTNTSLRQFRYLQTYRGSSTE
jgi:hypothetical protein